MLNPNLRKEVLSIAFVAALAAKAGFKVQEVKIDDDSVDVMIVASGKVRADSKLKSPSIEVQLKATANIDFQKLDKEFSFQLKKKNYEELRGDYAHPRYLFILLLPQDTDEMVIHADDCLLIKYKMFWLNMKDFPDFPVRKGKDLRSTAIKVPTVNILTSDVLSEMLYKASRREEFDGSV